MLHLTQDIEWSTLPAGQMHASAAQLMRHHPDDGTQTLMSRPFVEYLNRILPQLMHDEQVVEKQQRA